MKDENISVSMQFDKEFVFLMAIMTSLMALSIDTILPALLYIRQDLGIINPNQGQYIVSVLFLGFGIGQLFFGPISDSFGRKRPIYIGGMIYIVGCIISCFSHSLNVMLIGRALQGFGVASFRTISIAVIRDKYNGIFMAKIMSLVMTIFIMVPVLAPGLGQLVLLVAPWRALFLIFSVLALAVILWFAFKQEETLPAERRKSFSLNNIWQGIKETCVHPMSASATILSGLVFGGLIAYISSTQQIFQNVYKVGKLFPVYFGGLALMVGISSFINSKLVHKYGMLKLITIALQSMTVLSVIFVSYLIIFQLSVPPLGFLMVYFAGFFFCLGLLFGNLNSLALHPLGHIAGVASSVVGSLQNFIAVFIGGFIAHQFSKNLIPIISGFASLSILAFVLLLIFKNKGFLQEEM